MIADYYSKRFEEQKYGETITIPPETCLFIPVRGNLRATITAQRNLEISPHSCTTRMGGIEREVPALFWSENLVSAEDRTYIFETKYVSDSDIILPFDYLETLPKKIRKNFLRKVPQKVHELADELTGSERDSIKILQKFYDFIYQHEEAEYHTQGKPIEELLDEYTDTGYFYGNCKEARNFFMALCDAKGYPSKAVSGKALEPGGHVWLDVFVPVRGGYKLVPADATLNHFGKHNPMNHLFFEYTPDMSMGLFSRFCDKVRGENTLVNYKMSIERIR